MSSRWLPADEFRSLTTLGKSKIVLGWAAVAFVLMLGIGGNLGLAVGIVLGVVFATLGAVLWIGGFG
ncbi:hypothetical protein [Halobellus ruber]|uniref:Uncharacterized protein n=1 Tax=Halobellus ruber TaxID=2761102 RepID=A0A7J9SHN1_9EURY|nr:hypothetical protein [Halobellus ruber]MBB6646475.1 hypothetical protein [Halobellus ruber]